MEIAKQISLFFLCLFMLWGCSPKQSVLPPETSSTQATQEIITEAAQTLPMTTLPDETATLELPPAPPWVPEALASGEARESCADAEIDYSHTQDGYVMVRYLTPTELRLKVLIKGPTTTYSYNLPQGDWVVFPLSDGDGSYQVAVYRHVADSRYAMVLSAIFQAQLLDEFAPFLRPNQYVNYTADSQVMEKAAQLTAGLENPLDKVAAVYDFVIANVAYDYEKAATVKSGYLPVLDQVLEEGKGICFDYAALVAAMLRSQQIPCKLVVGYAGSVYHAWISVWTEDHGWIDGIIFFDGQVWKRMDPTFASSAGGDPEILDFIQNGTYTAKYLY